MVGEEAHAILALPLWTDVLLSIQCLPQPGTHDSTDDYSLADDFLDQLTCLLFLWRKYDPARDHLYVRLLCKHGSDYSIRLLASLG